MKQFLNGSDSDFLELENKAQGKCVRYKNQLLPSQCSETSCDIGFEVDGETNVAIFWVTTGISYSGSIASLISLFELGSLSFSSFEKLKEWVHADLAAAFNYDAHELPPNSGVIASPKAFYLDKNLLEKELSECIKGQGEALKNLSEIVSCHLAKDSPARPAVLFSLGPTGVGKTRTADLLSSKIKDLTPDHIECGFLRLDMSEYQESHRVSQLIGSPQGYVGHGEGSQLLDALNSNRRLIVLFDEIEKAHPAILRLLMNAMDAGRIASSSTSEGSYSVDCRSAIFIFTSNLNAKQICDEINGLQADSATPSLIDDICRTALKSSSIPPEILGRIGRFLVYHPLSFANMKGVLEISVKELSDEYNIAVNHIDPQLITNMVRKLKSFKYGARPLRNLVEEEIGPIFVNAVKNNLSEITLANQSRNHH